MTTEPSNIASRYIQRRVLLLSLIPLGLLFAVTVTLARTYHAREEALVREWFEKGNADLSAGQPSMALEDFRNSLSYDPENNLVQFRLAEALLAAGRFPEAHAYFLNLWDQTPGSGEVNLELAHISVRMGEAASAIRYYRGAIYGSWEKEPAQQRRNVRLELCEFLLAIGHPTDAQAELAGLAADTPPEEAALHEQTGRLFLKAADPSRALAEFESALRADSRQSEWVEDAGKAAYAAGDYSKAETYLTRAVRERHSAQMQELLGTVREVLLGDPFRAGLSDEEQARRSWRAFQQGLQRLRKCTESHGVPQTAQLPLSELELLAKDAKELKERVNPRSLVRQSDLRSDAMHLVFRIEDVTARLCGMPTGMDYALLLIEKKYSGSNQ